METEIIIDNLTNASFPGIRSAIARVGEKTVCATRETNSVYVDNNPRAYFYGCTGEQLRELFHQVVRQLEQQLEQQSN